MIISIFIPHGGCPERCTFCDQKVSGGVPTPLKEIIDTIEAHLISSKEKRASEIAFYGGTFTALSHELQLRYLNAVKPYLENGSIESLRISTRPDAIDLDWISHLKKEYKLSTIELGVQSIGESRLELLGRSHTMDQVGTAVSLLRSLEIKVGLHFMIGVTESDSEVNEIVSELQNLKPDFIRIHPLLVLEGTALAQMMEKGIYHPISTEAAIERCASVVQFCQSIGIRVIRIGLQTNEILRTKVLAGPNIPDFGELVYSRIERNNLEKMLSNRGNIRDTDLTIECDLKKESRVRGKNNQNIQFLKQKFQLSDLKISVRLLP